MRFADIDLSRLPEPEVVKVLSFDEQLAEMKADLIRLGDLIGIDLRATLEVEASATTKLLQAFCARELLIRGDMNDEAKAVMPAFAIGNDLEHMAARNGVERKVIVPADPDASPPTEAVMEDNESLRARMQLALEAFSTAGPEGAYLFHLLAVEGVRDGGVYSHEDEFVDPPLVPPEVLIIVLAHDGAASEELLATVTTALSASEKRPIGDRLFVQSANILTYEMDIEIRVLRGPDPSLVETQAMEKLEAYANDQFRVARAHRLTGIAASAHLLGAVDEVIINSPVADILPAYNEAAQCTAINVTVVQVDGAWNE